jgi:uncharacterized protein YkwD
MRTPLFFPYKALNISLQLTLPLALTALAALCMHGPVGAQSRTGANTIEPQRMAQSLNAVRARGCAGFSGPRPALRHDPRLSATAARAADGTGLDEALRDSRYRAPRSTLIMLKGYKGERAMTQGAVKHSCATVMDPDFRDFGFHVRGNDAWIALAVPFTPPLAEQANELEARVISLVNDARSRSLRCGDRLMAAAPPVRANTRLRRAAAAHASDMAELSFFSHTGTDGSQVAERARRSGYAWRTVGENIAAGQMKAETAMQGWLKSPSHCVNLMQPSYTEMGLAFAVNPQSESGVYWVQVFGLPE